MLKNLLLVIITWFVSCKPLTESQIQTNSAEIKSFADFNWEYNYRLIGSRLFDINKLKTFEADLTKAIDNKTQQQIELRKMRHKVRNFIMLLLTCTKPEEEEKVFFMIDEGRLCGLVASKLQAMDYSIIDIEQADEDFYYREYLSDKYDINKPTTVAKQQLYRDLLEAIARTNDASMEKYNSMFPFTNINWFNQCQQLNMRKTNPAGRIYSAPSVEGLQKNDNCQQLKGHVPQALVFDQEVTVYPDIDALIDHLRYYVVRLNVIRDRINQQLRKKSEDPAIKKENFLFVRDVIHMTDFANAPVRELHELYYTTLVEIAQQRLLPILLHIYRHKLYLSTKGRMFGLAMVRHDELKYPDREKVQSAIRASITNLVKHYLLVTEARKNDQQVTDKKIFQWLIHNEIAVAQIILQHPQHALVASHLLHVYQDSFSTPKWLQRFKTWSYRLDIIMIPVAVIGSIVAAKYAPPLAPAITNAAIAINLFWIASATADQVVAFNRYRTVERSLVSGVSIDAKRGIVYAEDLRKKTQGAMISLGLGGGLTIKALQLAVNKAKWATTIDILAALVSEGEAADGLNISGGFTEGATYQEEHNTQ